LRHAHNNIPRKEVFVNKEIVEEGYGAIYEYGDDVEECGGRMGVGGGGGEEGR